jgi:glycosyltransferase involved in cell wall biosynthesis
MVSEGPCRKLKVLQVVSALGMGGAETWLLELLRHWRNSGDIELEFLLTSGNREIFDDEARNLGARLHYLRYGRADLPGFTQGFRTILRRGRFDAIHDHADCAAGWHFLLGAGALPRVRVAHVHNPRKLHAAHYAVSPSRRLTTVLGRKLVGLFATHICGTSGDVLSSYGFDAERFGRPVVSVLHCGFDVAKFSRPREADRQSVLQEFDWSPEAKIVLFAGRLDQELRYRHPLIHKNSWFAVNVVRAAAERDASVRLLMAGAGDARVEIERNIRCWGLSTKLRLIGVRKDIPRLMRAADVLLFPSVEEGLGMVAVEAQAAGLPVLASTAVPRQAVVIPKLYNALSLGQPIERWVDALMNTMTSTRLGEDVCRSALEASPFSITASGCELQKIYAAAHQ